MIPNETRRLLSYRGLDQYRVYDTRQCHIRINAVFGQYGPGLNDMYDHFEGRCHGHDQRQFIIVRRGGMDQQGRVTKQGGTRVGRRSWGRPMVVVRDRVWCGIWTR